VELACVVVEELEIVEGEDHRTEWGIEGVPVVVADVVGALQVVA